MTGLLNYCSFLCCQFTVSLFLMFYQTLHFDIRFLNSVMHFDLAHCMVWYKMDTLVYPLRVSMSGPTLSRLCHMIHKEHFYLMEQLYSFSRF
ncbi:hypothetical protein Hanom_Chr14g01294551 [Helianthus anomalus]